MKKTIIFITLFFVIGVFFFFGLKKYQEEKVDKIVLQKYSLFFATANRKNYKELTEYELNIIQQILNLKEKELTFYKKKLNGNDEILEDIFIEENLIINFLKQITEKYPPLEDNTPHDYCYYKEKEIKICYDFFDQLSKLHNTNLIILFKLIKDHSLYSSQYILKKYNKSYQPTLLTQKQLEEIKKFTFIKDEFDEKLYSK